MFRPRPTEAIVIGAIFLAVAPLAFVFLRRNLHWLEGVGGTIVLSIVGFALLTGFLGGIGLTISRKNPLWLLAAVSALCAGYVWIIVATGMAIGRMH
jgi:hypothetical protein